MLYQNNNSQHLLDGEQGNRNSTPSTDTTHPYWYNLSAGEFFFFLWQTIGKGITAFGENFFPLLILFAKIDASYSGETLSNELTTEELIQKYRVYTIIAAVISAAGGIPIILLTRPEQIAETIKKSNKIMKESYNNLIDRFNLDWERAEIENSKNDQVANGTYPLTPANAYRNYDEIYSIDNAEYEDNFFSAVSDKDAFDWRPSTFLETIIGIQLRLPSHQVNNEKIETLKTSFYYNNNLYLAVKEHMLDTEDDTLPSHTPMMIGSHPQTKLFLLRHNNPKNEFYVLAADDIKNRLLELKNEDKQPRFIPVCNENEDNDPIYIRFGYFATTKNKDNSELALSFTDSSTMAFSPSGVSAHYLHPNNHCELALVALDDDKEGETATLYSINGPSSSEEVRKIALAGLLEKHHETERNTRDFSLHSLPEYLRELRKSSNLDSNRQNPTLQYSESGKEEEEEESKTPTIQPPSPKQSSSKYLEESCTPNNSSGEEEEEEEEYEEKKRPDEHRSFFPENSPQMIEQYKSTNIQLLNNSTFERTIPYIGENMAEFDHFSPNKFIDNNLYWKVFKFLLKLIVTYGVLANAIVTSNSFINFTIFLARGASENDTSDQSDDIMLTLISFFLIAIQSAAAYYAFNVTAMEIHLDKFAGRIYTSYQLNRSQKFLDTCKKMGFIGILVLIVGALPFGASSALFANQALLEFQIYLYGGWKIAYNTINCIAGTISFAFSRFPRLLMRFQAMHNIAQNKHEISNNMQLNQTNSDSTSKYMQVLLWKALILIPCALDLLAIHLKNISGELHVAPEFGISTPATNIGFTIELAVLFAIAAPNTTLQFLFSVSSAWHTIVKKLNQYYSNETDSASRNLADLQIDTSVDSHDNRSLLDSPYALWTNNSATDQPLEDVVSDNQSSELSV